ncbi:MAG: radical SAM protein [Thermodesulfobacteriota bacterium]|nr:radical SAM protein [Thermodesulfobacteriota bacterium]
MFKTRYNSHKRKIEKETGAIFHSWNDDRFRIALVYPNTYHQGMSNLGFLTVYQLLNQRDDCLCERFFLPEKNELADYERSSSPLVSFESEHFLTDFDLIAFSISFENDYLNLPTIFKLSKLPFFSAERDQSWPLVLFGGVCAFINPEPLADIVDLVAVGEAEPILPNLLNVLLNKSLDREIGLKELTKLPGIYVPRFYSPVYAETGEVTHLNPENGVPRQVVRQFLNDLDQSPSRSFIQTEDTEFGNMALTEVSRGCSRGCRFCAAGFVYLPPRERSLDNLLGQVDTGLCQRNRIGLVAAAVSDYAHIQELQEGILERSGQISMSSLRLDALTTAEIDILHQAGHKSVAIAPEAGSQRLRDFINKGISEEQILQSVQMLADGGIKNLKLYFIIGFPDEQESDIDAIVTLTENISNIWREAGRKRGQLGNLTLSVNPFIPKPFTPFQWAGMEGDKSLKKKLRFLQSAVSRIPNTRINNESIRAAILQTFLSRGDRRIGQLLIRLAAGENLKQLCNKVGLPLDFYVTRERGIEELFPWEIIDQGVRRSYLWQEYQRAKLVKTTPPCVPGCRRCGVCGEEINCC